MNPLEIKNDANFIELFDYLNAKTNIEKIYLLALRFYIEDTKKSPSELIDEARKEIKSGLLAD